MMLDSQAEICAVKEAKWHVMKIHNGSYLIWEEEVRKGLLEQKILKLRPKDE